MKNLSFRHAASPTAMVFGLAMAALASPAMASDAAADAADATTQSAGVEDDLHNRQTATDGTILVSAGGLRELDLLAGTSVLEAREIQRDAINGQIGDLLSKLPGVSSTSFAPGASRPVLRGQQGERVRVLIDGLGTLDVSNTSPDHAVTIEPITLERIEVLRGPAVLLYGSQAIGGAVNAIDKRIPTRMPEEDFHFDGFAGIDSASFMRTAAGSLDVGLTSNLVLHVDGSWRKADDMRIGGFQIARGLRGELLEEAAEEEAKGDFEEAAELREIANRRGRVPNSDVESWTANAGLGLILGQSTFGVAVGYYETDYGVIKRPGLKHDHGHGGHGHGGHGHGHGAAREERRCAAFFIDLLESVKDRETFFDFANALLSDKEDEARKEKESPTIYSDKGHNGWVNNNIEGFLDSAIAFTEDNSSWIDEPNLWKKFALFLYGGKIYE